MPSSTRFSTSSPLELRGSVALATLSTPHHIDISQFCHLLEIRHRYVKGSNDYDRLECRARKFSKFVYIKGHI
ncbi:hypothetical protein PIIN_11597 [Serendipita indica DSM 11827]|uniref:Uncharacterized protein n=1 Tax=Serendipita indica (strain DSM 11827) TaxID=1109443 RepID=G4U227_SERID|nr:hypothetical protein PIIN_11597 [Serendipita indica DSM 11827]